MNDQTETAQPKTLTHDAYWCIVRTRRINDPIGTSTTVHDMHDWLSIHVLGNPYHTFVPNAALRATFDTRYRALAMLYTLRSEAKNADVSYRLVRIKTPRL